MRRRAEAVQPISGACAARRVQERAADLERRSAATVRSWASCSAKRVRIRSASSALSCPSPSSPHPPPEAATNASSTAGRAQQQ